MRFGTYFFLQAPPGHRHADIIHRELDQMVYSEELGFDEVWLTEHHFIDYGLSVADRVHVLSRGQIVHSGTPGELMSNEDVKTRYLGVA